MTSLCIISHDAYIFVGVCHTCMQRTATAAKTNLPTRALAALSLKPRTILIPADMGKWAWDFQGSSAERVLQQSVQRRKSRAAKQSKVGHLDICSPQCCACSIPKGQEEARHWHHVEQQHHLHHGKWTGCCYQSAVCMQIRS